MPSYYRCQAALQMIKSSAENIYHEKKRWLQQKPATIVWLESDFCST